MRISELLESIKKTSETLKSGLEPYQVDKSFGNNGATIQYYFNLQKDTETLELGYSDVIMCVRNFVKKFQFPNTRTKDSFNDTINERTLLAPFRVVIGILVNLHELFPETQSWISLWEVMYFVFASPIAKNPKVDYRSLINQILSSRQSGIDLESKCSHLIRWKQSERQLREMLSVLCYASKCFKYYNKGIGFTVNEHYDEDKNFIDSVLDYNLMWYPSDKNNFELAQQEYIYYMDTKENKYNVIDVNDFYNIELSHVKAEDSHYNKYLSALKTKPFLLLAGISGTGKSRIVKEMAFDSCPDLGELRKDKTTPGNYCLVEVKPNWHDSTELLGYESAIKNTYVLTPFVKFLAKAMKYENGENKVPFFVCLDEMNLAPVEQYFAEFLSVLESRKLVDGKITSEPLVDASHFKAHPEMVYELFDLKKEESTGYGTTEDRSTPYGIENVLFDRLKNEGLRIPSNVVVIGTVNMDETTHQFSRKVIDRAMTIEMNIADGDEPFKSFFESNTDLDYREEVVDANVYLPKFASASNALQALEVNNHVDVVALKAGLPALLGELNQALNNTPFKIAYRVENELVLYFTALRQANEAEKADNLITQAMDDIMMMKVLPRIEGDDELLTAPLEKLMSFASTHKYANSIDKIEEMQKRLHDSHFTSFWP